MTSKTWMSKIFDHAWAAGFWEGDGSIYLHTTGDGFYRPIVVAGQLDLRPLIRLRELYGGRVTEVSTPKGKPFGRWRTTNVSQVEDFAKHVWPYLTEGPKKQKLKIAYYLVPCIIGKGSRSQSNRAKRAKLEEMFKAI